MIRLLVVAAVVLGINVIPAFAPPTWTVLVYFRITYNLPVWPLAFVGALSAAAGRSVLAAASHLLGSHLPRERRDNLEALGTTLSGSRGVIASLALFAVSPVPSNTLFEAAGIAKARLAPLAAAFAAGRLVSYGLSLLTASAVEGRFHDILAGGVTSTRAILLGVASLAGLVVFIRIDWIDVIDGVRGWLARRRGEQPPPSIRLALRQET